MSRLRSLEAKAGSRIASMRLSRLPPEATRLAQAVAILGDDADPAQAAVLADLQEQAASEAALALARVDVLRPQPPLGFVHPLIRAAVYEALTPAERDSGHARAARLLEAAGAEPERVAAHLLLAPRSGDPWRRRGAPRGRTPGGRSRCRGERRRLPSPRARRAAPGRRARRAAARARLRRGARQRRRRGRAPAGGARAARRPDPASRGRAPARPSSSSSFAATSRSPSSRKRWTSSPAPPPSSNASSRLRSS